MSKRRYRESVNYPALRTRLTLLLLAAAIAAPTYGAAAAAIPEVQSGEPNHVSAPAAPDPAAPPDPNAPVEADVMTPDKLTLTAGATIHVKVVSVVLGTGGNQRGWPRETVHGLTLSRDGQAVLGTADGKRIAGTLVRIVVSSAAGMMAFDRHEVQALALDTSPEKPAELHPESPMLVQNLLQREATLERLRENQQAALATCAKKHEQSIAKAREAAEKARQNHKQLKDSAARSNISVASSIFLAATSTCSRPRSM